MHVPLVPRTNDTAVDQEVVPREPRMNRAPRSRSRGPARLRSGSLFGGDRGVDRNGADRRQQLSVAGEVEPREQETGAAEDLGDLKSAIFANDLWIRATATRAAPTSMVTKPSPVMTRAKTLSTPVPAATSPGDSFICDLGGWSGWDEVDDGSTLDDASFEDQGSFMSRIRGFSTSVRDDPPSEEPI